MGYYTTFRLEIVDGSQKQIQKVKDFANTLHSEVTNGIDFESLFDEDGEYTKWYQHRVCMEMISKKFPRALFFLTGEGEETADLWHEYWLAGKVQRCPAVITFAEFNKDLLTDVS